MVAWRGGLVSSLWPATRWLSSEDLNKSNLNKSSQHRLRLVVKVILSCGSHLLFLRFSQKNKIKFSELHVTILSDSVWSALNSKRSICQRALICFIEVSVRELQRPMHRSSKVLAHPFTPADTLGHTVPFVFWIICCSQILTLTLIAALEWPQIPCECRWPWLLGYAYFKSRTKMKRKKKEWGKDMKAWKLH